MAIYHLKVSVGSRAGGQAARAKADYIEREGRYEQDREELGLDEAPEMAEGSGQDVLSCASLELRNQERCGHPTQLE